MKAYCITCRQTPWRTEAVRRRFDQAGLIVELFEGIHGATAGLAAGLDYFEPPRHKLSPGKIGLTLSKMLLWTHVAAALGDNEPVLICEDDVVLCPSFRDEFAKSYEALPVDWQVVHVGHCCSEDKPTTRINDRVSEIRYPFCCHAVLWRRSGLIQALSRLRSARLSAHSDILLAKLVYPHLRHYAFAPGLAYQENGDSEAGLSKTTWQDIAGWFDFATLYDEAIDRAHKPSVFVEVGCFLGKSSAYMAGEIGRRLRPVTFYCVDPWQASSPASVAAEVERAGGDLYPAWQRNLSRTGGSDWAKPLQMPSVEAANRFADGSVDFVFIDGDHSFEAVVADVRAWLPKMRPGGVLAGHDIDMEPVRRAVEQELRGRYRTWERCWICDL